MSADKDKEFLGTESAPVSAKETKDGKSAKTNKKKYPLWKNVLAMMIVLAVFIACAYWASILYTRHGKEVAVPNLNGLTVRQAMERLDALGFMARFATPSTIVTLPPVWCADRLSMPATR